MPLRTSSVALGIGALAVVPLVALVAGGVGPGDLLRAGAAGLSAAVAAVGFVLVPQIALAVAIVSLALQKIAYRLAGLGRRPTPAWIDPAVESALLLGMLGTLAGMVSGFAGLSPGELDPGPLVHALGQALRSSFVGFAIALVGIWIKDRDIDAPSAELA